jgi:hypothetical protein
LVRIIDNKEQLTLESHVSGVSLDKLDVDEVRDVIAKAQGLLDDLEDYEFDVRAKLSCADAALNLNNAIARLDYLMYGNRVTTED